MCSYMGRDKKGNQPVAERKVKNSRKAIERTATFGLILVALGLLAPFTNLSEMSYLRVFKWVYGAGALIFTIARVVGSTDPGESLRIRRLRRLEFWAGVAFCIGTFFWFYNEDYYSFYIQYGMGVMACLRDTVYFTLAGAVIQILAVIFISRRLKKEKGE